MGKVTWNTSLPASFVTCCFIECLMCIEVRLFGSTHLSLGAVLAQRSAFSESSARCAVKAADVLSERTEDNTSLSSITQRMMELKLTFPDPTRQSQQSPTTQSSCCFASKVFENNFITPVRCCRILQKDMSLAADNDHMVMGVQDDSLSCVRFSPLLSPQFLVASSWNGIVRSQFHALAVKRN